MAALAGVLADRFNTMRHAERSRYKATIEALSTALTARDGYTGSHSQETLWFVHAICDELRLTDERAANTSPTSRCCTTSARSESPTTILHEPGKLNDEQWEVMKQHPVIGERIVVTVPGLEEVARAIRHEHERWDGGGYPDGLKARRDPAGQPHRARLRRLPRDDQRPPVPQGDVGRRGAPRAFTQCRNAVRSDGRRRAAPRARRAVSRPSVDRRALRSDGNFSQPAA